MSTSSPLTVKMLPLSALPAKSFFEITRLAATAEDAIRLKRMGICEGHTMELIQTGDPMILRVVGCRVGVSRRLARQIFVQPCDNYNYSSVR